MYDYKSVKCTREYLITRNEKEYPSNERWIMYGI